MHQPLSPHGFPLPLGLVCKESRPQALQTCFQTCFRHCWGCREHAGPRSILTHALLLHCPAAFPKGQSKTPPGWRNGRLETRTGCCRSWFGGGNLGELHCSTNRAEGRGLEGLGTPVGCTGQGCSQSLLLVMGQSLILRSKHKEAAVELPDKSNP